MQRPDWILLTWGVWTAFIAVLFVYVLFAA
jgi:hypothetical protein